MKLDWIRKWARYTPGRMALRDHGSDRQWTYQELDSILDRLSSRLSDELGLNPGDRVAVLAGNIIEYPFLFFAAARSGLILVPLNFRLTVEELSFLVKDAGPRLILCESSYSDKAEALRDRHCVPMVRDLEIVRETLSSSQKTEVREDHEYGENDPMMILYTSGTTGIPKGAVITGKMLFYNSINTELRLDINSFDHTLGFAPFFHTGGWNVLLTPFIHHGASITILEKFEPDTILELIEKEKVTLLFGVPTMMQMMADSPEFSHRDLSSMRYAVVGGAPMPIPLIRTWHDRGIFIRQGYGLTEVGPNCFSLHQDDAERKKGSIGFPNFYIETRVMTEDCRICAAGETGELWLKSPVVTPGYWQRDEETREAITDGWFHTGDIVRYDEEGFFYVVDRKKNMFISGGENVYPAEIEAVLNSIPGVTESAVVPVPDEKWGESGKAFLVRRESTLSQNDVLKICRERLAKYKIPKQIEFIDLLPRNDAGKIDRKTLIQRGEKR